VVCDSLFGLGISSPLSVREDGTQESTFQMPASIQQDVASCSGKPHIHEVACFVQDGGLGRNLYRLRHTSNQENHNGMAASRFDMLVYVQSILQRCSINESTEEVTNQKTITLSEN